MGDSVKMWDISASNENERFHVINLVQMWISTYLLDGCYAVRLVTKQTLDYVNFYYITFMVVFFYFGCNFYFLVGNLYRLALARPNYYACHVA